MLTTPSCPTTEQPAATAGQYVTLPPAGTRAWHRPNGSLLCVTCDLHHAFGKAAREGLAELSGLDCGGRRYSGGAAYATYRAAYDARHAAAWERQRRELARLGC